MKLSALAFTATAAFVASLAAPASAAAPVRSTDSGSNAFAFFSRTAAMVCVDGSPGEAFTNASVTARQNVTKGSGSPVVATTVEMFITTFNTCDFSFTAFFGSDEKPTYTQKAASSASVTASIALFNTTDGMPLGTAKVSLAWTGSGTPQKSRRDSRDVFGNVTVVTRATGNFSDATATGSIFIGTTDFLTGATQDFAGLGDNTNGTVTFTRRSK